MGASPLLFETYELRTGNALRLLRELPDESVQTCTTSPPYYALRNYGTEAEIWGGSETCDHQWGPDVPGDSRGGSGPSSKEKRTEDDESSYGRSAPRGCFCTLCNAWKGELGLEPTVSLFIDHLVLIFREVKRVLRKDGTCFLNIADTYYAAPSKEAMENGRAEPWNLKKKDLCGVPHRLVFALQDDGWYWRNDCVWSKAGGNCPRCYHRIEKGSTKPESVKDRFVRSHEYVFVLTKTKDYFFDHIAVREPHSPAARRDVFHLSNQNFRQAHYATMPDSLAELCVRAGSPDGGSCSACLAPYRRITKDKPLSKEQKLKWGASSKGVYEGQALKDYEDHGAEDPSALKRRILERVRFTETIGWEQTCKCKESTPVGAIVLDPFSGSGTTGANALRHGRRYIGLELLESNNKEIADPRLKAELEARKAPEEIEFLPLESGVYHGPSEILLHRVPPESVRLILTDPPYNVSRDNNFDTMGRTGIDFAWDGNFDQEKWVRLADKALMPGGSIVIWNDWKVLGIIAHLLLDLGYEVKRPLTWYKCLSGATKVYARTKKGDLPISLKDLVRCDPASVKLWTGDRWSQVLSWSENPTPDSPIEIELRSGEVLKSTSDHRWPTVSRGLLPAGDLKIGDVILTTRIPQPDQPATPSGLDDGLIGWFVGLYIAEGSRGGHRATPKIQIAGNVNEEERHRRLAEVAQAFHGTLAIHHTEGKAVSANLTGRVLNAIIDTYVAGKDVYSKHLKGAAWQRSEAFLRAVLLGYLDGDGHFDAANDRFRIGFTRKNKRWAQDLRTLAARVGASIRLKPGVSTCDGVEFPTWRGEIRFDPTARKTHDAEIVDIRACRWGGNFWDVEIEDDPHLFALASGVLTHNSNPWPRNVDSSPVQRTESGLWAVKRVKQSTKWVHNRRPHRSYEDLFFEYPVPTAPNGRDRHETKKPDDLFREIIQIFSNHGDLILDPFSGGGTTAYAAEAEGRRHISFEKEEKWYHESLLHWEEGKKAPPLVFPTTPEEKARAAFREYKALCKRLGVNPITFESLNPTPTVVESDTPVEILDTHQVAVEAADGTTEVNS